MKFSSGWVEDEHTVLESTLKDEKLSFFVLPLTRLSYYYVTTIFFSIFLFFLFLFFYFHFYFSIFIFIFLFLFFYSYFSIFLLGWNRVWKLFWNFKQFFFWSIEISYILNVDQFNNLFWAISENFWGRATIFFHRLTTFIF